MRADNRGEGGILALIGARPPHARRDAAARGGCWSIARPLRRRAALRRRHDHAGDLGALARSRGSRSRRRAFQHVVDPDHGRDPDRPLPVPAARDRRRRARSSGRSCCSGSLHHRGARACGRSSREPARPRGRRTRSTPCASSSRNGRHGFLVLGSVFLVVTGGEALYADMGHFGARPIRHRLVRARAARAAAELLRAGRAAARATRRRPRTPSTAWRRAWALYPLVVLATVATVIASQALISGAFSLTRQAVQLGYSPRVQIDHTSAREIGQIYIPAVNWVLMVALHRARRSASAARATSRRRTASPSRRRWRSRRPASTSSRASAGSGRRRRRRGLPALFLVVDLAFFGANIVKVPHGGWFPLVDRRRRLHADDDLEDGAGRSSPAACASEIAPARPVPRRRRARAPPPRVPGTAVFMSRTPTACRRRCSTT